MLENLTIQNFGLIDKITIDFDGRLNILTGSTGAGKSIVIDALRIALGERLKPTQQRDTEKPCIIEAVFDLSKSPLRKHSDLSEFLADADQLVINRQCLPDNRQKIRINGFQVTIAQLKTVGNLLVDFHGAHDHQMLLDQEHHISMLDQLTDFGQDFTVYQQTYREYREAVQRQNQLQELAGSRARDLELLEHQVKELGAVSLKEEDYQSLCQDQVKAQNAEKLYENVAALVQLLDGEDSGVNEMIRRGFGPLRQLNQVDETTARFTQDLENIQTQSDQLAAELKNYLESLSLSPQEAAEINQKFDRYQDILRKYGPALNNAAAFYAQAKERYDLLVNMEHNEEEIKELIVGLQKELKVQAAKLTRSRQKTALLIKKTVEKELKDLGFNHVAFEARVTSADFHSQGSDEVVFYISPNAGEDLKPLSDIVSSGEAARVMLALKKALTKVDPIPVLIFDEIDAQIGGRLGAITGQKLKELSRDRQVILITHLPQIASFADQHLKVTKLVEKGRTLTRVDPLDKAQRVEELAHMLSGDKKSDISFTHAKDMLASAGKV